jgi:hypothetical protein
MTTDQDDDYGHDNDDDDDDYDDYDKDDEDMRRTAKDDRCWDGMWLADGLNGMYVHFFERP